jgi:hypothetical protein
MFYGIVEIGEFRRLDSLQYLCGLWPCGTAQFRRLDSLRYVSALSLLDQHIEGVVLVVDFLLYLALFVFV